MTIKKILLVGDSFVENKDNHPNSWASLFDPQLFIITNIAQRGCSEYAILKQLKTQNLNNFDLIIVGHTSPNRLYFNGSIHDGKYTNTDLIFTDIENIKNKNDVTKAAYDYFLHLYDQDYHNDIHKLLCKEIETMHPDMLHISGFDYSKLYNFNNFIGLNDIFLNHNGEINHFTPKGNEMVYNRILKNVSTY